MVQRIRTPRRKDAIATRGRLVRAALELFTADGYRGTTTLDLAARWGVEVESIRSTAAGYMLDFRYRVVDAEKARPLFKRQTKPYLIDQETGARLMVPSPAKTGPLRNSNLPKAERTYFMFFANPGQFIKPGKKVSVVIGDFRAENLVVR